MSKLLKAIGKAQKGKPHYRDSTFIAKSKAMGAEGYVTPGGGPIVKFNPKGAPAAGAAPSYDPAQMGIGNQNPFRAGAAGSDAIKIKNGQEAIKNQINRYTAASRLPSKSLPAAKK